MKCKICLVALFTLIFSTALFSQEAVESSKVYLKVYGSYGVLSPGSYTPPSGNTYNGTTSTFTVQSKGMGSGPRFGGGIGVILNDFINLGIDVDYLMGSNLTSSSNYVYPSGDNYHYSTEIDQKMLSIIPNITFRAVSKPNYYIYTRLGIAVGIPTVQIKAKSFNHYVNQGTGNTYDDTTTVTSKYTINVGLGYQAAIGIQFTLTEKLRGFVEITANSMVLHPTKLEDASNIAVEYVNTSKTPNFPQSIYIIDYKKSGTYNYTAPVTVGNTTTYTSVQPQFTMNVNSINIGLGIAYRF